MPDLTGYRLTNTHVGDNQVSYLWIKGIETIEHTCYFDEKHGMMQRWKRFGKSKSQTWDAYHQDWTA